MRVGKNHLIIGLLVLVFIVGGALKYGQFLGQKAEESSLESGLLNQSGLNLVEEEKEDEDIEEIETIAIVEEPSQVVVDIKGAVANPGVVVLPQGSRLNDALLVAQTLPEANLDRVNLARFLEDGEAVYIPYQGQKEEEIQEIEQATSIYSGSSGSSSSSLTASSSSSKSSGTETSGGKVNINKADSSQLQTLNGIGPAKAQAIINYREEHGSFKRIEDITNVSGIGSATFEKLKNEITVD